MTTRSLASDHDMPPKPHPHTMGRPVAMSALLMTLVTFVLSTAFLDDDASGQLTLGVLYAATLLATVLALWGRPRLVQVGLALFIPQLALGWIAVSTGGIWWMFCSRLAGASIQLYVALVLLQRLVELEIVDLHAFAGVVANYLLIAMMWASVYTAIVVVQPAAFSNTPQDHPWPALLYFSFATLTTVGYGDITALTPLSRAFAMLEGAFGVLYVALVIGRFSKAFWEEDIASRVVDPEVHRSRVTRATKNRP